MLMRSQSSSVDEELDKIRESIVKTFSGQHGERVLKFLEDLYQNQTSAVPNDPYSTFFNEGGRGLVLGIKAQIRAYKASKENQPQWSETN